MEEIATNENREIDLPSDVKLPEKKDQDKEGENSDDKVDQIVATPAAVAEGNQPQKLVDTVVNSVDNADSVNQLGNQTINVTVTSAETSQGAIDQEKEKIEQINNDDKSVPHTTEGVTPNDSSVQQMEDTETSNVNPEKKEEESKGDSGEQLDKEDNVEPVVPSEEVVAMAPNEVSAQVISNESPEKDDGKTDVPSEKAEEVSTSESLPSAQIIDESPGDNGTAEVPSEGMTEVESTESQPSTQIADKESPGGDPGKTEAPPESTEITVPETQPSAQLIDKESTKEVGNENTTNGDVEPPVANQELKSKEEAKPVSAETSEVTETKPENTGGDEAGGEEKQPGGKDQDEMDKTEKDIPAEGSPSQSKWYTDDEGNLQQENEGYSTSVVGGVVVRKPLPSTSSEPKKPAKGSSTGSVFQKIGSIFGRKKSVKDKPNMAQQAATETPVHDGTDGVQEPNDSDKKESSTPVDTTVKEASQEAAEPGEATTAEKPQENKLEVPVEEEEKDDIVEGAIVPLEEGVVDEEEKTTKLVDEALEQDELNDDVESPTDEDSVLRERIAKRESGTPSHSPTKHMQMRMSYAEGTKEVEVIGTREAPIQHKQDKPTSSKDNRLSCRELGEVDHEGWLTKRGGGAIFASWKRKWVVLKEQHVYYYKTSFDPEAGGVIDVKDHTITAVPEMKRKFCFKIEAEDPKSAKVFFAADSQEDMDKWISVLTSASRGEVIVRKTQNQESDDVTMRKKTNSLGKRAGSVLGLGGYYTYDGELEKKDPKRRASFGSSPKEAAKNTKPLDKSDDKDRSQSPTEDATPSDIQKLMTQKTEGDSVDAPVAMETSPTAPLKEKSCSPEVTDTVALATSSEEPKPLNIEADVKISSSEITKEECPPEIVPLDKTMATPETSQSEIKESSGVEKDTHVATPSEQPPKPSQPIDPSNTTWYYVLDDDNNDWIDIDEQKAMAAKRESDELLSLVRTIKDARLSIIGTPLPGNEDRARAMTHVSKQNDEVLKLREMRRTLKDKQRDLMAMEELLTKEVNRQSIHEWKTRYSYLTPEQGRIDENEVTDIKENGSSDEKSGGELGDGEVTDGKVGEKKLDDNADVQEVNSEESGKAENGIPEHDGEVGSGGEDQDTKPKDSDEAQQGEESGDGVKSRDETSGVAGNVQEDGHGGKDQDTGPKDSDEAQKDGETGGGKPGDGGESTPDKKSEDTENVQDDGNGGESPQDSKLEESADVPTNAKDDTNEIRQAKEDVDEKKTDEVTKQADEATQEEPNNNSGSNKSQLPDQSVDEPQKNDEEKETSDTLPLQDQDSIDTRL